MTIDHIPQFESDLTDTYLCPACPGAEFDTLFQFNRHRRERHGGRVVLPVRTAEVAETESEVVND